MGKAGLGSALRTPCPSKPRAQLSLGSVEAKGATKRLAWPLQSCGAPGIWDEVCRARGVRGGPEREQEAGAFVIWEVRRLCWAAICVFAAHTDFQILMWVSRPSPVSSPQTTCTETSGSRPQLLPEMMDFKQLFNENSHLNSRVT